MNTNPATALVGGIISRVKSATSVEVTKAELIDRGPEGRFVFAPYEVRNHIFTYLDIEDLFDARWLGVSEANCTTDLERRQIKNYNAVPVVVAIGRVTEIKQRLEECGYGMLDAGGKANMDMFIELLEEEERQMQEKLKKADMNGTLTCEELCMLLNVQGKAFAYNDGEVVFGFISQSAAIKRTFFGTYIEVRGMIHSNFGEGISAVPYIFQIPYYRGKLAVKDTGVSLLEVDQAACEKLVQRGKKYVELTSKPAYRRYSGVVTRRSWWANRKYKADGRIMVDVGAMRNIDPDYDKYFGWNRYERNEHGPKLTTFTNEQYASMSPYVYGFSFSAKAWGEMTVDEITDIKFREDAYDMLVMKKSRKDKIFALVDNNVSGAKDFIDGKGGGCIFLLAGPPGGGKTLTAEAIAERLKRPLYMVGVGELGTDVTALEESLRKILDVATTWNAVLLIDECDIFMEERSEMDVERNAMVGVFLRLLEYYEGVLFLTTNRAENIDPAFYSRISMALYYEPLDLEARKIVWGNLLKIYGVENVDIERLAHYDLNGRKIKGVIRIAKALAADAKRAPVVEDFIEVIDEETEFRKATGART